MELDLMKTCSILSILDLWATSWRGLGDGDISWPDSLNGGNVAKREKSDRGKQPVDSRAFRTALGMALAVSGAAQRPRKEVLDSAASVLWLESIHLGKTGFSSASPADCTRCLLASSVVDIFWLGTFTSKVGCKFLKLIVILIYCNLCYIRYVNLNILRLC